MVNISSGGNEALGSKIALIILDGWIITKKATLGISL